VIAGVGTSAIEPGSILSSVIIPALIAPRAVTVVSVLIVAAAVITGIYFITDKQAVRSAGRGKRSGPSP
jgi:hypothetical protein